jgi:hypothetical protein
LPNQIKHGQISVGSLPRFRQYTSSVRHLDFGLTSRFISTGNSHSGIGVEVYACVLKLVGTVPLFQHLTDAHFPSEFLTDARRDFFVGPKLANVHLHLRYTLNLKKSRRTALADQIKRLRNAIPALTSVAVYAETLQVDDVLTQAVLSRPDLKSVSIFNVLEEDKGRILPLLLDRAHVKHIKIAAFAGCDPSFVVDRYTEDPQSPIASIRLSFGQREKSSIELPVELMRIVAKWAIIKHLDVTITERRPKLHSDDVSILWRDYLSTIPQDAPHVRHVSLAYTSARLAPGGTNPIFIETFGPLLSLSELEKVDIYFGTLWFVFNDGDVARAARAWPRLRAFEVQGTKWTCTPTVASLRELARGCPRLERLKMPLDASTGVPSSEEEHDTDHHASPLHGLRVLAPSFSGIKAETVPGLARYIKSLFPNVRLENTWTSAEAQLAKLVHEQ